MLKKMKKINKLKVRHYYEESNGGLCGPVSLRILLSYFGKKYSEKELKKLSSASTAHGTEHEGLVEAIKKIGGYVFAKEYGSVGEIKYFIEKEKLPVLIGWFDTTGNHKPGDHYAIVTAVTQYHLVISDPDTKKSQRKIGL